MSNPLIKKKEEILTSQYHDIERVLNDFKNGATYSDSIERMQNISCVSMDSYASAIEEEVGKMKKKELTSDDDCGICLPCINNLPCVDRVQEQAHNQTID